MIRKFLGIMGITLCVFLLAGCGKRAATEGTKKSNCSLVQNNIEFKCPAMKEIKDSGEGFFITNKGELYEFANKTYDETNNNCKKIETDIVFDKIIRNTLITNDGKLYSFDGKLKLIDKELEEKGSAFYGLKAMNISLYREYNNMFFLHYFNQNSPVLYGVIEDKSLYVLIKKGNETVKNLIHKFGKGEEILKVTNGYILTDQGYYQYGVTNSSECKKNSDVNCEYGIVKVDTKKNCSDVIFASSDIVVTNDMISE